MGGQSSNWRASTTACSDRCGSNSRRCIGTHGSLGPDTIRVTTTGIELVDFAHASMFPTEQQLATDVVSMLAIQATVVGPERALDAAVDTLDRADLEIRLPDVQGAVIEPHFRTDLKAAGVKVKTLRAGLAERLEVEPSALAARRSLCPRVRVQFLKSRGDLAEIPLYIRGPHLVREIHSRRPPGGRRTTARAPGDQSTDDQGVFQMSDTTTAGQHGTQSNEAEPHYMRSTGRIAAIAARFIGYLAYVYIIFVEIILFLGFFLLLFGANPSSSFVEWAYRNLDRAMKPFRGIFTPIELGTTNGNQIESVFDTSVLFAMIIGLLIHSLIQWLTYKVRMIERQEHNEEAAIEAERLRQEMLRSGMAATTTVTSATPTGTTSTTATAIPAPPPSAPSAVPPPPSSPMV
jgi:hypothetical protein